MEKKKDLLYEKFKDRCSDNGITGEEGGDIEMCWIIARDILTQERKQELDKAREEGIREGLEDILSEVENWKTHYLDTTKSEPSKTMQIGLVNVIRKMLSKLTTK